MNKFFVFKGSFSDDLERDYVPSWGFMFYTKEDEAIINYLKSIAGIIPYRETYAIYEDKIHVIGHGLTERVVPMLDVLGYEVIEVPWEEDTTDRQMREWILKHYPDESIPEQGADW